MIKANGEIFYTGRKKVENTNLGRGMSCRNRLIIVNQNGASVRIIKHDGLVVGAVGGCKTFCVGFAVKSGLF